MATRTTKGRTGRATRTRTEVQNEFADIAREVETAEAVDPKTLAASEARANATRQAVQGVTVEDAVQRVTRVGLDVQKALASVSEQLLSKVTELEQVTAAVEQEKEELESLHKIDIAATSIDILVQDHAERTRQLDAAYAAREKQYQETEAEREKARREREAAYTTQVQREREDYEYRKTQERRAAEDAFTQQQLAKSREAADRQAALEKGWQERETALRAQEAEVTKLRQDVQDLPVKLRKEFDAEKATALNALKSNLEHAHQLAIKDHQANEKILNSTLATLQAQLAASQEANTKLQAQLTEANAKIEGIARSAIDGASKRDAFEQLMSVTKGDTNGTVSPGRKS